VECFDVDGLTGGRGATAVELRPGRRDDAEVCGRICYEAFSGIADTHGFPSDFASLQVGLDVASAMLAHPQIYAVVAEIDGRVVGCNFLDERSAIVGVGPVGVDPAVQNRGVGRALMLDVLRRAADRRAAGVRLLQSAYHSRSLSLYASLGFTAFTGHAVGESDADIEALILAADAFHGSGILVPITNGELFRWCLEHGLHVVHTMTLMSVGLYTTPRGAYLPSVQF
jgi:predicted N-acetyltransferase YhbS